MDEGFNIELILADSLYGESGNFWKKIGEYNLDYVVMNKSWSRLPASQAN